MNAGRFNLLHHVTSTRLTRHDRWAGPRAPNIVTWLFVGVCVIAVLDFLLDGLGWW